MGAAPWMPRVVPPVVTGSGPSATPSPSRVAAGMLLPPPAVEPAGCTPRVVLQPPPFAARSHLDRELVSPPPQSVLGHVLVGGGSKKVPEVSSGKLAAPVPASARLPVQITAALIHVAEDREGLSSPVSAPASQVAPRALALDPPDPIPRSKPWPAEIRFGVVVAWRTVTLHAVAAIDGVL